MKIFNEKIISRIFYFKFFIILPFAIFFFFIFKGINLPYVGPNAGNFIVYSHIAHNYNTFGYFQTKFASVISIAKILPKNPEFFLHHPPLLSIIESLFFKIFGEGFWVGRLTVILFASGTMLITYIVSKTLMGGKNRYIPILIMSLIPATTIFGKMIGQEPLVLFFIMLTLYFILKYLDSNKKIFFLLSTLTVALGTISDWPMVLFSISLIPLFVKYKKIKMGVLLAFYSIILTLLISIWIIIVGPGFYDLRAAFSVRGFTGLMNVTLWPVLWTVSTLLRLFIYFNPIFILFSVVTLFTVFKKIKTRKYSDLDVVIFIFFIFGATHLALYTQASFTHPYLNYYMLPFITFATSSMIVKIINTKRYIFLFLILFLSSIYLILVTQSKAEQTYSNVWRYQMAFEANKYLAPYETVVSNKYYGVDLDIWRYPFLIKTEIQDRNNSENFLKNYKHYIYSCLKTCNPNEEEINSLKDMHKYVKILSTNAEMYVFFLKEKQNQNTVNRQIRIKDYVPPIREGLLINSYRSIRDVLKIPQI